MKVGDLVKILIVDGKPLGVVTKVENSTRWCVLYEVRLGQSWDTEVFFREHQLEAICESR
jgi:hypothetical protein